MKVKRVVADIHITCALEVDAQNPNREEAVREAVAEELFFTDQLDGYVKLTVDNIKEV